MILIAGVLTIPLAFDHQSADARNVKVKSVKNTIKNKIQAITRAAGTGNDGISSDGSSGTGTNGNPGSSTNGVPGTEGSRGIVIALPGVDGISDSTGAGGAGGAVAELQVLDVLAPAVTVAQALQAVLVDLTSVYRALFLAELRVNRL